METEAVFHTTADTICCHFHILLIRSNLSMCRHHGYPSIGCWSWACFGYSFSLGQNKSPDCKFSWCYRHVFIVMWFTPFLVIQAIGNPSFFGYLRVTQMIISFAIWINLIPMFQCIFFDDSLSLFALESMSFVQHITFFLVINLVMIQLWTFFLDGSRNSFRRHNLDKESINIWLKGHSTLFDVTKTYFENFML